MRVLAQDFRYSVRQLRKSPGITALVIVTVALGIGVNTSVFSLLNGFLRPLRVKDPARIVVLAAQTKGDETGVQYRFSYPALVDFRSQANLFSDIFAFNVILGGLGADGKTAQVLFSAVSGNYFPALGLKPAAGRLFRTGEGEALGKDLPIVLGHSYWQKRFGGNFGVVGKQVRLDGKAARIVGVAPQGFHGLYAGAEMDCYLPLNSLDVRYSDGDRFFTNRGSKPLTLVGRMKPGVNHAQAQSSLDVVARRMSEQYPATDKGIGVRVVPEMLARPLPLRVLANAIPALRIFVLILAGMVLMLACLNVANILMVRATIREREMAIRAALGSGRWRLLRQMFTESAMLAALGGLGGLVLGKWGSDAFAASIDLATDFPTILDFSFDWRVFLYALAAAVSTGIVIGVWPALHGSRADTNRVLHDGGRSDSGGGKKRLRGLLVVAQVAGSLVLLIVAGLFARSLQRAQHMDLGFRADRLFNVRMDPDEVGYSRERTRDFYRELLRRVRGLSGVQSASMAFSVPMGYIFDDQKVQVEGLPSAPGEQLPSVGCNYVDTDYFETIGIPLTRGRAFLESDGAVATAVAIVNQTMASRFWPRQSTIGRRFRVGPEAPYLEVVGVAHDSKYLAIYEPALPYFYVPLAQTPITMRTLQVRSLAAPESVALRVQQEIQRLDPDMPLADSRTMNQSLAGAFGGFLMFRLGAIQGAAMGILGLVLAAIGVYGVVSYGASQRTHEIGIRMALGADPVDIRSLVLGQGLRLVVAGVLAGLAIAAGFTRLVSGYVMLATTADPVTFTVVTLLLAAIALWACYLPARRAMRVDPIVALRHE
jgi:putative ABC transport system permease protein